MPCCHPCPSRWDTHFCSAACRHNQAARPAPPLMAAVQGGRLDYVDTLLNKNAYPSAKDRDGSTALYYAIYLGYDDIAKRLIKSGSVVYGLNNGYTLLH